MILICPQFESVPPWMLMSSGFELKLDPEARDSQTVCAKVSQAVVESPRASVRFTPNSANSPAETAWPLIALSAAAMSAWFTAPSNNELFGVTAFAPQHGIESWATTQVPLLPPS